MRSQGSHNFFYERFYAKINLQTVFLGYFYDTVYCVKQYISLLNSCWRCLFLTRKKLFGLYHWWSYGTDPKRLQVFHFVLTAKQRMTRRCVAFSARVELLWVFVGSWWDTKKTWPRLASSQCFLAVPRSPVYAFMFLRETSTFNGASYLVLLGKWLRDI